ncbi:MAG: nitrous oxide reductase family maturation protein NosD [Chromatiales bacterium]|nr:nitrous oxide reductase family maturation protein NosD [Chromatiales bacterium]
MQYLARFLFLLLIPASALAEPSLQLFIDFTRSGGTLRPPPGTYSGPITIKKPIILDGMNQVTIDGRGAGTVVHIQADNVTFKNFHITNSGNSHDQVDAGILITSDNATVEDNTIDKVLFGIHLQQANSNTVQRNTISSRRLDEPSLRGESIRLWYSNQNLIKDNQITSARDLLLTNSADNIITGNTIEKSRIAMELIHSSGNTLSKNIISDSDTGVVLIYSDDNNIVENEIKHLRNIGSSALAVKGSSQVTIEGNTVLHCRTGLIANTPTHAENILNIEGNKFLYNDVAMYFYGDKGGHILHDNFFKENITEVAVSAPLSARGNDWRGNTWQSYQGFDQNNDGVGDTPYEVYLYSDRLWMDRPMVKFFRSSPVLELVDLVERLAPFSDPDLILSDSEPRFD